MRKIEWPRFLLFVALAFMFSCKAYKQDIMFRLDENFSAAELSQAVSTAEQNYRIQKNDLLSLVVYTNKGERIVDPNFELRQSNINQNQMNQNKFLYLVREDGLVKLPIIGDVDLLGMAINEAEQKLQQLYSAYYIDPFVVLRFENKRVIVLGTNGGQVIPLANDNTSLIEVVAMSGGISQQGKSNNVRVIRGDPRNPSVFVVDLSTISGMQKSMIRLEPGDIVYIEPWRRVWLESLRDVSPALSLVSSVITLALVIQTLANTN